MTLVGQVVSLQVGRAGTLPWRDREVRTAIVKTPVTGALRLGELGFDGDGQADLQAHGGPDKAVCCYPSEHLAAFSDRYGLDLGPGAFGENLTLAGLVEEHVHVGDVFALGTATVQVSQPRGPCFKVAARWGPKDLVRAMARDLRAGFYVRVLDGGEVAPGDTMTLVERVRDVSIAEVLRVTYRDRHDPPALQAVLDVPELAAVWRDDLVELRDRHLLPMPDPIGDA